MRLGYSVSGRLGYCVSGRLGYCVSGGFGLLCLWEIGLLCLWEIELLGLWEIGLLQLWGVWAIVTLGTEFNQEEMAQPKRFNINKVENFLKNSADNAQTRIFFYAAVEHGKYLEKIDENLASNDDDKQIAELLLRQTDAMNRRERLIKVVENAIKLKYQPQIPEVLSAVNKEIKSQFVVLQRQNSNTGRVIILISALQDENQILNYLDLEEK